MSTDQNSRDRIHILYHEYCHAGERNGLTAAQAHAAAYQRLQQRFPAARETDLVHTDYLIAAGENQSAEELLSRYVELEGSDRFAGVAWEKLGILQLSRGATHTALVSLETALSLRDTYGIRRTVVLALYGLGRTREAVACIYQMLNRYHRVDRELLMVLADCHVKTDEFEDAIMVLHQLLMGDRHNLRAYEMLQQLKWRLRPEQRTDLVELPPEIPAEYITLQTFEMEHNPHWPYWQEIIDAQDLPVVLLASDRDYRDTIDFSGRISNRTLFRIMMNSRLHLTENLFSQHFAGVLELPVIIVGSPKTGAVFNTPREKHLSGSTGVEEVLEEINTLASERVTGAMELLE